MGQKAGVSGSWGGDYIVTSCSSGGFFSHRYINRTNICIYINITIILDHIPVGHIIRITPRRILKNLFYYVKDP